MSKIRWSCCELGVHGVVMIGADLDLSGPDQPEALLGYRRAVHPFQFDNAPDPRAVFLKIIQDMSDVMGRAGAQSLPASRAGAFGDGDEALGA